MADGPYSRLYHQVADEFPDIVDDDACFALWVRLLIIADQAWPSVGTLPYGTKRKALDRLIKAEMVTVTAHRFHLRGMDKEREARAERAKAGAEARWRNANGGA